MRARESWKEGVAGPLPFAYEIFSVQVVGLMIRAKVARKNILKGGLGHCRLVDY